MNQTPFTRILELADAATKRLPPEQLKWQWGEALYTYSLLRLDDVLGEARYQDYCERYLKHHLAKGYRVDQSDTSAPAITAYHLWLKTGNDDYKSIVDRAINYMKTTPRVLEYMPNHLGTSPESWMYPKSVWVDSVMMYGVFSSWYGKQSKDNEVYDFALRQPALFAQYLQDPEDKLFYHSYWTRFKHTYPKNKLYWGRGNGWVIAGFPLMLEHLGQGPEFDNAVHILQETSAALLPYQREDGFFETVFNKPGKTYIESSATALIASGWLQGYRSGYLDESYKIAGMKALNAVLDSLEMKDGLLSMPLISAPTIPVQLLPYLGYKLTPRGNDWTYGLASLFFAGMNYQLMTQAETNG